jgi:hypothetical protein
MKPRAMVAGCAALVCVAALATSASVASAATAATNDVGAAHAVPLTNLAHLNSLLASVTPPAQAGHTTYRLASEPSIGVLWVYSNHESDGSFSNTGGGNYDAATNTYGQGSFDADDIARAAVVYLRHWQQTGDLTSRAHAEELLRGLTYLQTATGPNAGNVVLWMQPDGTLHPTPTPPDNPNPADTGASYWLARTVWALGEGYADFRGSDPAFAHFLGARMQLAVAALDREVLTKYGTFQTVHGRSVPAWLIQDGADASAEAVLGLSSYVNAGGGSAARIALSDFAEGIALLGAGNAQTWPYGALMPSAVTPSDWHAWASQMPEAVALAAQALHRPRLLAWAVADAATFAPHLLTATGPSNGWLPAASDNSQIAYGVDSQVQSLLAVGDAVHSQGMLDVAGLAAGWFFGSNNAGAPTYDPATGVANDGVSPDGVINGNSGAESTIHALLTMEALDARPAVRSLAQQSARLVSRSGTTTTEAEAATLGVGATVVTPASAWTGEALYSGGAYVAVSAGATLSWTVPAASQDRLVQLIVDRLPGQGGSVQLSSGATTLGTVNLGGGGAQGAAPAIDELLPVTLSVHLPAAATTLTAQVSGGSGRIDAVQLTPLVSTSVYQGAASATELFSSQAPNIQALRTALPGAGQVSVRSFNSRGREIFSSSGAAPALVVIVPGGFALATQT